MIRALPFAAALCLTAIGTSAVAQEAPPAPRDAWAFSFGAATDNRSKDASKSDGDPFAWATAQWESADGFFYAGPGLETIKSSTGSELEAKAFAGIRPEVAGFDLDLNVAYKYQVDANPGADEDAWEFTGDVKRSIGPASGRIRLQYSPDGTGGVEAWTWVEARAGWDFTPRLNGSIGIGRREQDNSIDYTGWDAGFTFAATRSTDLTLRWYATDADASAGRAYEDQLVGGISFSF